MDFYNDIESFIQAYLYFNDSPHNTSDNKTLHPAQKVDQFDLVLDLSSNNYQTVDHRDSHHTMEPLTQLDGRLVRKAMKQQLDNLHSETGHHTLDENLEHNGPKIKAMQQISGFQCGNKGSGPNELRGNQLQVRSLSCSRASSHVDHRLPFAYQ